MSWLTPDLIEILLSIVKAVVILLVVVMNLTAILIRNRLRKKYAASSF